MVLVRSKRRGVLEPTGTMLSCVMSVQGIRGVDRRFSTCGQTAARASQRFSII